MKRWVGKLKAWNDAINAEARKVQRPLMVLAGAILVYTLTKGYFAHRAVRNAEMVIDLSDGGGSDDELYEMDEFDGFDTEEEDEVSDRADAARVTAEKSGETAKTAQVACAPEKADSAALRRAGMSARTAHNAMRYRAAGGKLDSPDKVRNLYGMTDEEWGRVKDFLIFRAKAEDGHAGRNMADLSGKRSKLPPHEKIDLNRADTSSLKQLPGIGTVRAERIVRYRERLGGYRHLGQLAEAGYMPDEIVESIGGQLFIDTGAVRKIRVRHAAFGDLMRHPYIGREGAQIIVQMREAGNLARENLPESLERAGEYMDFAP